MVLAVMVCILIFRVYQVLNPPPSKNQKIFGNPEREAEIPIPVPPIVPAGPDTEDWSRLWRFPPFIYLPPRTGGSAGASDPGATSGVEITLEMIRAAGDGTYRAKIRTPSKSTWYTLNQAFEQFTLVSIDPVKNCVVVFSEQEQKELERCITPATP